MIESPNKECDTLSPLGKALDLVRSSLFLLTYIVRQKAEMIKSGTGVVSENEAEA